MKILVVGSGGREHALAWKLASDSTRPELFCAPGNAGTRAVATNLDIGGDDLDGLMAWAKEHRPDLTVVGPEVPLCEGLVDLLEAEGLSAFGPCKDAARIEGSKVFAKEVMDAGGVPTARSGAFSDPNSARSFARELGLPLVVKAEGLAAGKGVLICETEAEVDAAIDTTMVDRAFGDAGDQVLIEEFLHGEEASIFAMVDGEQVVLLASSQDHKRAFDGDEGPNTGGMGAYSPAPVVTDALWPVIREQVFDRTLAELKKRGIVFKGILYAGLMIDQGKLNVLEFNCRFGDPETQCVLARIKGDLLPALQASANGTLSDDLIEWHDEPAVVLVMASGGYPGPYEKGKVIRGLEAAETSDAVTVFHAGTSMAGDDVVTAGGRVLGITARGADLKSAVAAAYDAVEKISFEGAHYRRDIAGRALNR